MIFIELIKALKIIVVSINENTYITYIQKYYPQPVLK